MNLVLRYIGIVIFILVGSACKRGSSDFVYKEPSPKVPKATAKVGRLEGKVTDPNGNAIDGVSITSNSRNSRSDRYGRFQVGELPTGQYLLDFSHPIYHPLKQVRADIVGGRTSIVNLVLTKQPGTLSGRVTDATTGALLENVLVEVSVGGSVVTARTDSNGNYTVEGLNEGPYRVSFSREKYVPVQNVQTQIRAAQTTTLDMKLAPAVGRLRGRVTDGFDSAGVKDVEVAVRSTRNVTLFTVRTDEQGYYEVGHLEEGEVRVDFRAQGYTPITNESAQIYSGQTATLNVVLNSTLGILRGHVTNAVNAHPLMGVTVTVHKGGARGPVVATLTTDANGDYRTLPLAPGNYSADFELDGFVPLMALPAELKAGQITVLDVSLTEKLRPGQFRIVMSWTDAREGAVQDVDSYLDVPGNSKPIYFGNMDEGQGTNLDVDDTTWSGPETITITRLKNSTYTYYVNNYDNRCTNRALGNSKVTVQVYGESGLLKTYRVPSGTGITYKVFQIVGGRLRDVERYDDSLWIDGGRCGH